MRWPGSSTLRPLVYNLQKRDGRRSYFQAESASPIFSKLRGIIVKTPGVEEALKGVIVKFGDRVTCAFLYGSVARQQEHTLSDIDLMIIGSAGLAELSPSLRVLEKQFGQEINVTCYSPKEFRKKVRDENHFVTSVLKGDKDEPESLAGKRDRADA